MDSRPGCPAKLPAAAAAGFVWDGDARFCPAAVMGFPSSGSGLVMCGLPVHRFRKAERSAVRLRGEGDVLAPPCVSNLWVGQKTAERLRFGSVATDIPSSFSMASAELRVDYVDVAFADGSSFVLPSDFTVITAYRREEATRNVVRFSNCDSFRAKRG